MSRIACAECNLRCPSVTATNGAGYIPARSAQLSSDYVAGEHNTLVPIVNGSLFKVRQFETELHTRAIDSAGQLSRKRDRARRNHRWLNMNAALEGSRLTRQGVEQPGQSLDLAQTRYELGLSSLDELIQQHLSMTNAELQYGVAQHDYLLRRSVLTYLRGGS